MSKFCVNCGKKLDEDTDMCLKCGKLVDNKSSSNKSKKMNSSIGVIGTIIIIVFSSLYIMFLVFLFASIIYEEVIPYHEVDDYLEDREGRIGESIYYNDLVVTLKSVNFYDKFEVEGDVKYPKDGYEYMVLLFNIKNNSVNNHNLYMNNFSCFYDGIKADNVYVNSINGKNILNGYIRANSDLEGNLIFEVKKGSDNIYVEYYEQTYFNKIMFKIDSNKERYRVEF